ncbi:MAG: DUF4363 family protein [Clostridiales bacterium]|nr:DUF4363 family protein [Clostridiales bacterium]
MKRFAICTVLFPLLLALGALCMSELTHVKEDVLSSVDELYQAVESGDTAQAGELAEEFQQHWENTEHHIMAFVRHGELDEITMSVAKLPALIEYEETASVLAELDTIRRVITHIWDSERFLFRNIV